MADPVSIGINIAIQFALRLAIAALTPKQNTEGPRLEDLSVTTSTYGNTIPLAYGTVTLSGNVIWGRNIEEVATKTDIGKGNPFSLGTNTTYEYFATFAVALAKREAEAILKIYADGKVIYDVEAVQDVPDGNGGTTTIFRRKAAEMEGLDFRFYPGSSTQMPDPIISEDYPAGETPAYRGTSYLVFNRLPLKNFGNRIPQLSFVVAFSVADGVASSVIPRVGGVSFPNLDTYRAGIAIDYANEAFWMNYSVSNTPSTGEIACFDLETGDRLGLLTEADFFTQAQGSFSDIVPVLPQFIDLVNLKLTGVGDTPYLVLVGAGSGTAPHHCLDKWTLRIVGISGDGFGMGGIYVENDLGPDRVEVDSSGGGATIAVQGVLGPRYYHVGAFGGLVGVGGITFTDGIARPQEGLYGIYSLPDFILRGGNREIAGKGRCQGMTRTYQTLGFTHLLGAFGSSPVSTFQLVGLELVRFVVTYTGDISHSVLTIVDVAGDIRTRINRDVGIPPIGFECNIRYDARRDIALIDVDNGDNIATYAFFLNSEGNDPDLTASQVRELWYAPTGSNLGDVTTIHYDNGASAPLDGTFLSVANNRWDIHDIETGQLIETVPYRAPYRDANGVSMLVADGTGTKNEFWDYERRATFQFRGNQQDGWIYIDYPLERGSESLRTVVEDIALRSKLTPADIDASALSSQQVRGYVIGSDMTYRAALEPLATVYNFYGVENAGELEFKFKTASTSVVVPETDIVTSAEGVVAYEETRAQENELPKSIFVEYMQFGQSDSVMIQGAYRNGVPAPAVGSLGEVRFQFPLVLTDAEAAEAVNRILYETWISQEQMTFTLPPRYMEILPNDVLDVTALGRRENIRVTRAGVGQDLSVVVEGNLTDGNIYDEAFLPVSAIGSSAWTRIESVIGQKVTAIYGAIVDAPFPDDLYADRDRTQGSLYFTIAGTFRRDGAFSDTSFLVSLDAGSTYAQRSANQTKIAWMQLNTAMPPPPSQNFNGIHRGFTIDATEIDGADLFTSTTEDDLLLRDANAAMIYNPTTGIVEFVSFRLVSRITSGTSEVYRFSEFLRGKRGTDVMAYQHLAGAYLILMTPEFVSGFWEPNSTLTNETLYRPVTVSDLSRSVDAKGITYAHRALMPYAPVFANVADSGSDKLISWTRRTRIGGAGALPLGGTVPTSEDAIRYEIDILDGAGGPVVRTLTSSTNSVTYTFSDAQFDFGTSGFPVPLRVKIYQISAQVGRGFAHEWALT